MKPTATPSPPPSFSPRRRLIPTPSPYSLAKLEQHPRHRGQDQRDEPQRRARPADPQVLAHLHCEQRERSPYLARLLALAAEATAVPWYVSTKYCIVVTKRHVFPHENGIMATAGLAQWISGLAVQPNQKIPSGMPRLPIRAGTRRHSGGTW